MSPRDLWRSGVFSHVYLHSKFQKAYSSTSNDVRRELRSAGFSTELIKANVRNMRKLVGSLEWKSRRSEWNEYASTHSYTDADFELKKEFVTSAAAERRRRLVWDLGCNVGTFSRIAAEYADCVVAMDGDRLSIEQLYQTLKTEGPSPILPLTVNLADFSPNRGWRGQERRDLPSRGKPELTLCLALLHHLVIGANIPLSQVVEWLAELGSDLVIEFVGRDDPMVQKLLRNKSDNYRDYDQAFFEACLHESFAVERKVTLASQTRTLYYARPVMR
jgi:ribosomal protein L11 methylase PrmA